MGIVSAGAEVGTGKTKVGKAGTVCAAPDGCNDGGDLKLLHSGFGAVNEIHVGFDFLFHVVVGIPDFCHNRSLTVFLI